MKRLLLLAAVMLLSLGASAQNLVRTELNPTDFASGKTTKFKANGKAQQLRGQLVGKAPAQTMNRVAKAAPEGEAREYMFYDYEPVYGFVDAEGSSYLYPRLRMTTLYFTNDGKVYVPNTLYTMLVGEDNYLEGVVGADGSITIAGGQSVGRYVDANEGIDVEFFLYKMDSNSGAATSDPIVYTYDAEYDQYILGEDDFIGIFIEGGTTLDYLYTYCLAPMFTGMSATPEPMVFDYTYTDYSKQTPEKGSSNVCMYTEGQLGDDEATAFVGGLIPAYPKSFVMFNVNGLEATFTSSTWVVSDDALFSAIEERTDGLLILDGDVAFTFSSTDGTATLPENYYLADIYVSNGYYYCEYLYGDILLTPSSTGISGVTVGDKEAVATEYYDLSGRRIGKAAKGLGIKVTKYADGTSKAEKAIF